MQQVKRIQWPTRLIPSRESFILFLFGQQDIWCDDLLYHVLYYA